MSLCRRLYISGIFLLLAYFPLASKAQDSTKPHIIVILIDDLNDYTTSLSGHPQVTTPGISALEATGTNFTNAHCSSPKCSPSRTSFITGKDVFYTQLYNNVGCEPFRDYFSADEDNEEVFTMPEYFKDHGGYFTFGINKINHCFDTHYDYDSLTADPCEKTLSWNKYSLFRDGEDSTVRAFCNDNPDGIKSTAWCPVPDSYEELMYDYRAVDTAAQFFEEYTDGTLDACGRPMMMFVGFRKPHQPWYIPEKYFRPDYITDYYAEPMDLPYNTPLHYWPANGVEMPPQPDTLYDDFFDLPDGGLGQYMGAYDSVYFDILDEVDDLDPLPVINPGLDDVQRAEIMEQVVSANLLMAYMASIKFLDAQIVRLLDTLAHYPEIYNNCIIVLASDHGYSLGEKRHWEKGTMWETDQRVPLVISDMRAPIAQQSNQPASLLDLFPTLCDMADIPVPVFTDGSNYLDGVSLMPLMNDPETLLERPALSAYEEHNGQLSCRPQYSLRNDRFHYILYTSNGPAGTLDCNAIDYYVEEELYEIGAHRETDPNEWYNLANDPDYRPVMTYLQQWLPDSALYLQKNFAARIDREDTICLFDTGDIVSLTFDLFDPEGSEIVPPDDFIYKWTNNFADTALYGVEAGFDVSDIPDDIFNNADKVIWYLHVMDSMGGIRAFDLAYYYINPASAPEISFNAIRPDSFTALITDFEIEGNYNDIWWDFGEGIIIEEDFPGPYVYASAGEFFITCYVAYGNTDICVEESTLVLTSLEYVGVELLSVYPNPGNGVVMIASSEPFQGGTITVFDTHGKSVYKEDLPQEIVYGKELDLRHLASGVYFIRYAHAAGSLVGPYIKTGK